MKSTSRLLIYVIIFAIAMGFMESAIVIYLRELFYPGGFTFPLTPIPNHLAIVEILREAATVIMLIVVGYLAGNNKTERFAFFAMAFAVWDLVYYLFLRVFTGWPQSLATWDILFLIPIPWVGPVWAPCLVSLLMLCGSAAVIIKMRRNGRYIIHPVQWLLIITGAFICICSFVLDYIIVTENALSTPFTNSDDLFRDIHNYVPQEFHNNVFFPGFLLMLIVTIHNVILTNKTPQNEKA